jgi:hypothetical protein
MIKNFLEMSVTAHLGTRCSGGVLEDSVWEKGFGVGERIRCAVDAGDQRSMRVLLSRLKEVGKWCVVRSWRAGFSEERALAAWNCRAGLGMRQGRGLCTAVLWLPVHGSRSIRTPSSALWFFSSLSSLLTQRLVF